MRNLFVLIRDDLKSPAYKAVQAGHAVAQFMVETKGAGLKSVWKNDYLYYLVVKDEAELKEHLDMCRERGWFASPFREPDLNDQYTAFAVQHKGYPFKHLPLLE